MKFLKMFGNAVLGAIVLSLIIVALILVGIICMTLCLLWLFPIVAAVLWSWWWLLAELPVAILYVWMYNYKETDKVNNGENYDSVEEEEIDS